MDYNETLRVDPNDTDAYSDRGAYFKKGDIDRAIANFEAALRIDPNNNEAKDNFERVRRERGR